jgi:hypothetical protein
LTLDRLTAAIGPARVVVGWATVELDRAEVQLAGRPDAGVERSTVARDAAADEILGARCRVLEAAAKPEVVLLEPSTEGLLAAALARRGEGIVAAYLVVDVGPAAIDAAGRARRARFTLSSERPGPLGRQRLVRVGPRWGPFLLLAGLAGPGAPDPR